MNSSYLLATRFTGHQGSVYSLCRSKNMGHFYSGGSDRMIVEWNLNDPSNGNLIARASEVIYCMELDSIANKLFVGQASGGVHVIDLVQNKELNAVQLHMSGIFALKLMNKSHLISLGGDGVLKLVDTDAMSTIKQINLSSLKLRSIAVNAERNLIYVGCGEGKLHLIDNNNFTLIQTLQVHERNHSINTITILDDKIFTGSRDGHIKILDSKSYNVLESIPAHNYAIYGLAIDPLNQTMASVSRDKSIKLWDIGAMKVMQKLSGQETNGHINSVNTGIWYDNDHLITAGDDRSISLWKREKVSTESLNL